MYTQNSASYRHDLKNHYLLLRVLIEKGERKKALDKLEELNSAIIKKKYVKTGVKIIDSILTSKIFEAENFANVKYEVIIPNDIYYDEHDMTILFGNLMDLAIQEVKKIKNRDKRNVSLKVMFEIDAGGQGWININLNHDVLIQTITLDLIENGLVNVLKLIKRYKGIVNYGTMGEEFKVEIKMLML